MPLLLCLQNLWCLAVVNVAIVARVTAKGIRMVGTSTGSRDAWVVGNSATARAEGGWGGKGVVGAFDASGIVRCKSARVQAPPELEGLRSWALPLLMPGSLCLGYCCSLEAYFVCAASPITTGSSGTVGSVLSWPRSPDCKYHLCCSPNSTSSICSSLLIFRCTDVWISPES